jgi:hypothetical protein
MSTRKKSKEVEIRLVEQVKAYTFPTLIVWFVMIIATSFLVGLVSKDAVIAYDNIWGVYLVAAVYITHRLKKKFNI